jgi:hypothetical protein
MNESLVGEACSLESLVGRMADEFLRRQEAGERPDVEEYIARYPQAAEVLRKVLASLQLLRASLTGQGVPAGDSGDEPTGTLGDFRLIREVGRGGRGVSQVRDWTSGKQPRWLPAWRIRAEGRKAAVGQLHEAAHATARRLTKVIPDQNRLKRYKNCRHYG